MVVLDAIDRYKVSKQLSSERVWKEHGRNSSLVKSKSLGTVPGR